MAHRRRTCTVPGMSTSSPLLVLLGTAITILGALAVLPQVRRTWKTGDGEGLSLTTCFLALPTMLMWCTYTYRIQDWPAFAGSVAPALGFALVIAGAVHHRLLRLRDALLAAATALLVVALMASLELDGVAAMLVGCCWAIPQAVATVRSDQLSGVAVGMWVLIGLENAGWVVYAAISQNWLYAPTSLVQVPVAILILTRIARARRSVPIPAQRSEALPQGANNEEELMTTYKPL